MNAQQIVSILIGLLLILFGGSLLLHKTLGINLPIPGGIGFYVALLLGIILLYFGITLISKNIQL